MFFIIIPSSVGLILLRSGLVKLIYMHGIFNAADAQKTAGVLLFFIAGLWASALLKTVVPVFYSMKDTKTPVNAAIISLFINISFAVILMRFMGVYGLALASSISLIFNYLYLLRKLHIKKGIGLGGGFFKSFFKTIIASIIMGVFVEFLITVSGRLGYGPLAVVSASLAAGVITYILASLALKNDSANILKTAFMNRRQKPS
jgi:putative peptidoglycan lipid II flippase